METQFSQVDFRVTDFDDKLVARFPVAPNYMSNLSYLGFLFF